MNGQPDYVSDDGYPVWTDITDQPAPCDAASRPTDYPDRPYVCAGTAERRYGAYRVCNYHFDTGRHWAAADALDARGEAFDAARLEREYAMT